MYPKVRVMGMHLPTYGIMVIVALLVLVILGLVVLHNAGLPLFDGMVLGAYGFLGAYLGAKLLFLFQNNIRLDFRTEEDWLYFFSSGGCAYGGILLGLVSSRFGALIHKIEYIPYMEKTISLLPLSHGIWKIGCHCAGCCYGIPYDGIGSIFVRNERYINGRNLFPVQMAEAVILFVIAFVLSRTKKSTVGTYLIPYSICRFFIEFLRNDATKASIGFLSDVQYLCLVVLAFFTILKFVRRYSNEK